MTDRISTLPWIFVFEAVVVIVYMTAWFVVAQLRHRNDVADVAWGLGFVLAAVTSLSLNEPAPRALLVTALVAIWAIRLSLYVHFRNRGKAEDFRYRKWREEWGSSFYVRSYLQVFFLQSVLLLLVSTPVIYVNAVQNPPLTYSDAAGIVVWAIGFYFEAVGDHQLRRFMDCSASIRIPSGKFCEAEVANISGRSPRRIVNASSVVPHLLQCRGRKTVPC